MKSQFKKLIAVTDSRHLMLYEADGLKITAGPTPVDLPFTHHKRPEKGHGSYGADGYNVSAAAPHTMPVDLDHQSAAKLICEYLDKLLMNKSDYHELIITAEPRMLGCLREHASKSLQQKISKEIHKDLVNKSIDSIEQAIFK